MELPAVVWLRVKSSESNSSSLRSIRSVTWVAISVAVAPGHWVAISMVLIEKLGSSSRPRLA